MVEEFQSWFSWMWTEDKMDTKGDSESFFSRPQVFLEQIQVGKGVPLGIELVTNPEVGIGGAYGAWGEAYDNNSLPALIEQRIGEPLSDQEKMNLAELGFIHRHHLVDLSPDEHVELEIEVGVRFLKAAAQACTWDVSEVDAVLVGLTGPAVPDYCERIADKAGIPEKALKVSVHKACDSSVGGLQLALNPSEALSGLMGQSLASKLLGKKVLVGGIEGLSRVLLGTKDKNALQLFGNGAGVIGVVPGKTMKFLVGKTHEVYDEEGVLEVRMTYPHSGRRESGKSMIEVTLDGYNHIRVAGLMHEPESEWPVVMAGPMGMVKLFVRTGTQVIQDVYLAYQRRMAELDMPNKSFAIAVVHHANYKINKLLEKNLQKEGIHLPMPWVLSDFGNVSAASNMIAFLRKLSTLKPGDHVLFDSFGAGTYYDVLAVELGA
jgi:3-oxoacyl-[acyl-carrier-protein] synthase III